MSTENHQTSGSHKQNQQFLKSHRMSNSHEILGEITYDLIDVNQIQFPDDWTWLYEPPIVYVEPIEDVLEWLHKPVHLKSSLAALQLQNESKSIDTRTFTRPKKRFTRPSIEQFNDEFYGLDANVETLKGSSDSGVFLTEQKPLNFDLSQPATSSYYFENILAKAVDVDSFQNMSPPSLVNSMCSSTFANLMESSFIKNDPVLREIRDTDYTQSILQQQEDGFSSINSDTTPESFLNRVSIQNGGEEISQLNETYTLDNSVEKESESKNETYNTYKKRNHTFRISDLHNESIKLNATYEQIHGSQPQRKSMIVRQDTIEEVKKQFGDGNNGYNSDLNYVGGEFNNDVDINRLNSFQRSSTGSADSLDRMSSLSNSSRGSNKINLDVDDAKDRNKQQTQIMSTPKHGSAGVKKLWDQHHYISPIVHQQYSDSDQSSNDEYKARPLDKKMPNPRSKLTLNSHIRSIGRSYTNLRAIDSSQTNLKSMGTTLKGSYTSLKPISRNLPVAPPMNNRGLQSKMKVAQVPPIPREKLHSGDGFAKPQLPRFSGLPRPVGSSTGIPRPASRIPGPPPPRSNLRPLSNRISRQTTDG